MSKQSRVQAELKELERELSFVLLRYKAAKRSLDNVETVLISLREKERSLKEELRNLEQSGIVPGSHYDLYDE